VKLRSREAALSIYSFRTVCTYEREETYLGLGSQTETTREEKEEEHQ